MRAGSWGALWRAACPPVAISPDSASNTSSKVGFILDPPGNQGSLSTYREHLARTVGLLRLEKPVWSPAALSAVCSCHSLHPPVPWAFPITCGQQMLTLWLYGGGGNSFPTQPSWLGCENIPSCHEGPAFAFRIQRCIRTITSEEPMHLELTPHLYWHSLNWWTPLVPSSWQSKPWQCTKLGHQYVVFTQKAGVACSTCGPWCRWWDPLQERVMEKHWVMVTLERRLIWWGTVSGLLPQLGYFRGFEHRFRHRQCTETWSLYRICKSLKAFPPVLISLPMSAHHLGLNV